MERFETPGPIAVSLQLTVGAVRIDAAARTDTTVTVRPSSEESEADRKAVEQVRVGYADGTLQVRSPKARGLFGRPGSVTVEIALPEGSRLDGVASLADFVCEGALGECRLKTSAGDIRTGRTEAARLTTQYGDIAADHVAGRAEVTTGSGEVRIGVIDGEAVVKNSNGDTRIGEVTGDLRLRLANGGATVGLAHRDVTARSANGSFRLGEVVRGTIGLETSAGDLRIGVREGTAAWLDVHSKAGTVHSSLEPTRGPGTGETVEVHARTSYGDIEIHRAGG
ncbi:DUF4097 family beta strand repeat-containing protein [Streptomyces albiaxialis]|uniref:DUF4097 family beta strand repeat-containing protein n=1 Tax=Streptomyces albiaxialis TaxID=329523 RepID=A0ABN2WDG6_9ACTN